MHLEGYDLPLMTTVDDNMGIECFGDIPPNNWTLLACDGKDTYCNNPAVVLTDINIPPIHDIPTIILPSSIHPSYALLGKAMFVNDHSIEVFN